jgi:Domain of unknown function (DUF1905)
LTANRIEGRTAHLADVETHCAACGMKCVRHASVGDGNDDKNQGHAWAVGLCEAELVVVVFDAELWGWDARRADSWIFVSLPAEASEEIRDLAAGPRRGFGSVRVRVTVGDSTWTTSIFPDSVRGGYVLPIKRAVRQAADLDIGDVATVTVTLIDL